MNSSQMNRISPVLDRLIGIEDPSELVTELEEVISDSVSAPEAGQFFVFSYVQKKRIQSLMSIHLLL